MGLVVGTGGIWNLDLSPGHPTGFEDPAMNPISTFVPSPLPSGWGWQSGGNSTLALRRTERSSTGGLLSDAGPLASDLPGQAALRSADGTVWWIPLDKAGGVGANPVKLLVVTTTPDSFFGHFSVIGELRLLAGEDGYVGVEFQTGAGRRFGWIRFNQHSLFTGRVSAGRGVYVHYLDLVDFGCGTGPEAEAVVGANSMFPLGLGVALESGNLRLTWDLTAGAGRLESSRSITGEEWVQEPTGALPGMLLPMRPDGQPQYFRLRLSQVFPATH